MAQSFGEVNEEAGGGRKAPQRSPLHHSRTGDQPDKYGVGRDRLDLTEKIKRADSKIERKLERGGILQRRTKLKEI